MTTAFVLGGGVLGAVEVGMLRALFEREINPDLILGTSVGALNGAVVARDPSPAALDRLTELWRSASEGGHEVYGDRRLRTVRRAVSTGTHIYSAGPLKKRLALELGHVTFEELPIRFRVRGQHRAGRRALVRLRSGRGRGHGQRRRPCCRPRVGDEHYLDGGS